MLDQRKIEEIHYIQMTDIEKEAWLRDMAELCIEMFIEEQQRHPLDTDTTHTQESTEGLNSP